MASGRSLGALPVLSPVFSPLIPCAAPKFPTWAMAEVALEAHGSLPESGCSIPRSGAAKKPVGQCQVGRGDSQLHPVFI